MRKIFISHCQSDAHLIAKYNHLFTSKKGDKIFFSSNPETGIKSGGELMKTLNQEIEECSIFIPIITENYLRSAYCMYELNIATYLFSATKKKSIVPIVTNSSIYKRINTINNLDLVYIDATNQKEFITRFSEEFFNPSKDDIESFRLDLLNCNASNRPYVNMDENVYKNIIAYFEKHHICSINNAYVDSDKLTSKVKVADEIIILSTTGTSLIKKLSTEAFVQALKNKARIKIITPNLYSDFIYDVAQLERPSNPMSRFQELADEFNSTMGYLIELYQKVKSMQDDIGTIEYYCSFNMLRQTVILIRKGEEIYGSLGVTLPPKKTIDGTPTIVFDGKDEEGTLPHLLLEHTSKIMELAQSHNAYFKIDESSQKHPFFLEKYGFKEYWHNKYEIAKNNMIKQDEISDSILIEVAAQHPLNKDGTPGKEFTLRLNKGIELYHRYKNENIGVKIYIPGSRHQYQGIVDNCSLSYSGINYLIDHGVPKEDIYPEDINYKYKGEDGIYNTADECYVASKIFFNDTFSKLISVCSPNQVTKVTLLFIEFGIVPLCYSEPTSRMYHDIVQEIDTINYILYIDHNGQDPNSDLFVNSRKERKPK